MEKHPFNMGEKIREILSGQTEYLRTNVENNLENFRKDSKKRIVRIQKNLPSGYLSTILPYPKNYDKLVSLRKNRITIYDKKGSECIVKRGRLAIPKRKVSATRYLDECLKRCDDIAKEGMAFNYKLGFFENLDWTLRSYEGQYPEKNP